MPSIIHSTIQRTTFRLCAVAAGLLASGVSLADVHLDPLPISKTSTATAGTVACPWLDSTASSATRTKELVAAMTLTEKLSLLHQPDTSSFGYGSAGHITGIARLCMPDLYLNDAGAGVGDQQAGTTAFPAGIAQAASWDTSLQTALGAGLGAEARAKGVNVMLAPGLNIARTPLNGRNFEYAGEDPFLSGQVGAAIVNGIQSQNVIATIKHFAVNSQETNRSTVSSNVDERTLQEIYMPAFETAVKQSKPGAVMCSYNKINDVYACENPHTLTDILKHEFAYNGFVMSDWGATHSTVAAANAGLDMEMSESTYYGAPLTAAVAAGDVTEARITDAVSRIALSMFRIGLFDHPVTAEPAGFAAIATTDASIALARKASAEGTVLLKNVGNVLPIAGGNKKIALIGQAAGAVGAEVTYGGAGSSHIPEAGYVPVVSPQQGITARAAKAGDVVIYTDGTVIQDAVAAAKVADYAIVYASNMQGEGTDRTDLTLQSSVCFAFACLPVPVDQDALIAAVAAVNPHTIVVLNTGGVVLMPWLSQVKGVLEAWYPGQEGGNAIADLLYGDVNPSGKLPETFPVSQADIPTQTAAQYPGVNLEANYTEGMEVGYRWYDAKKIAPLFPFGYGLSYTTFTFSKLAATATGVTVTVTNTGTRAGAEVAQVYVSDATNEGEPPQQLKGFTKVQLEPGKSATVTIPLTSRSFAHWDLTSKAWKVNPGNYGITVGSSSRDPAALTSRIIQN